MQTILIILIALVVLGGGYLWWSQSARTDMSVNVETNEGLNPPPNSNTETTLPVGEPNAPTMDAGTAPLKEFTVSNQGLTFNPNTLSVKKGDRVKITFKNTGGTHDLRVDGYNVGTEVIEAGQSQSFEFVASNPGTFEFYCSVSDHRAKGMRGELTVSQ